MRDSARIYFVTFEIYALMAVYQNNLVLEKGGEPKVLENDLLINSEI